MIRFSSAKKKEEPLFKREAYIPKKRLEKKGREVPIRPGKKGVTPPSKKTGTGKKILIGLLWVLFVGEVLYTLFFAQFFTIQSVSLKREGSEQVLSSETMENFLNDSWSGEWFRGLSKNNLLFVHPFRYEEKLRERFAKISEVRVERQFPGNLTVTFTEKPYQLLWCKDPDCFLVNEEGTLTEARTYFEYPVEQGLTIRIQDNGEESIEVGKTVLAEDEMEFIKNLQADFSLRTGFAPFSTLERPHTQAKEMRIQTEKGFMIFFNTSITVNESLNNLMLVLQKEIPESDWDKIVYIDLRTENRVYYTRSDKAPEKTEEQKKREEEKEKQEKEASENQNSDNRE